MAQQLTVHSMLCATSSTWTPADKRKHLFSCCLAAGYLPEARNNAWGVLSLSGPESNAGPGVYASTHAKDAVLHKALSTPGGGANLRVFILEVTLTYAL